MSLTSEEKQQLARRITKGIQVVCSSIAQLHLTSPDPRASLENDETGIITSLRRHGVDKWKFTNIEGALLLTRDKNGFCHFRIYDLDVYKLRFQYELYENMNYEKLSDRCHAFEMESCVCGFSFSDSRVADKFFDRVQNNITRTDRSRITKRPVGVFSPGFSRPMPRKRSDRNMSGSSKSNGSSPNEGNLYLENGLLDPENVPTEWKKILRKAGIKKKDLRNPKMQDIIKETLAKYDISLDPPPLDMENAEIRQYYTPQQLAEYEQYRRDLEAYQRDMERYDREMEEYERQQAKQKKLEQMISKVEQNTPNVHGNSNMTGAERLRQSVMQFQGKEIASVLPSFAQQEIETAMPRMSVAKPIVPALPPIPKADANEGSERQNAQSGRGLFSQPSKREKAVAKMVESRNSKMMIKAGFLSDIKKNEFQLRHVSVLPTLKTVTEGHKEGILNTLMERVRLQREALGEDDEDSDSGDEFSDFEDDN